MAAGVEKMPITQKGYDTLVEEHRTLKSVERPAVITAIEVAREHGDLKENAEYHAAREKQSFIEGRILELESKISFAQVIDPSTLSGNTVKFGATVKIVDEETDEEKTYQLVGLDEANLEKGLISITSPIAKGLIGKNVGDSIEIHTPGGGKTYEILEVKFI